MGAHIEWLAVETADKVPLLESLGFAENGRARDEYERPLVCAEFPHGWIVIVSTRDKLKLDQALPLASRDGLALGGEVEEHVMCSRLRAFRNGALQWSLTHAPEGSIPGVASEGQLPPLFEETYAALKAEEAEDPDSIDALFDLPVRLGQQLCGYRYDTPLPVVWVSLEHAKQRKGGERSERSIFRRVADALRGPR
jgi:hypothetical protein